MIPYLDDFWDLASETGQDIGNAVAGALGNFLLYPLQCIVDFGLALGYALTQIMGIASYLLLPLNYVFDYVKYFIVAASQPVVAAGTYSLAAYSSTFLALPGMTLVTSAIAGAMFLLLLMRLTASVKKA